MANTLGGITHQRLGEMLYKAMQDGIKRLEDKGYTHEQACEIVSAAVNRFGWNMGTCPMAQ